MVIVLIVGVITAACYCIYKRLRTGEDDKPGCVYPHPQPDPVTQKL